MSEPMKRQAEPHEDDVCVHRIEVEFAIPVYIPQAAMRETTSRKANRRRRDAGRSSWSARSEG